MRQIVPDIKPSWIIVVLYNPDDKTSAFWLSIADMHNLVVIDNSPHPVPSLLEQTAKYVFYNHNLGGIAGALNQGLRWVSLQNYSEWCFLFDQDSRPSAQFFTQMEDQIRENAVGNLALCAPVYFETNLGRIADTIEIRGPNVLRHQYNSIQEKHSVRASYTITSGSAINLSSWRNVGGYDENLFLDFVDIEWGLRAASLGYTIRVFPQIQLTHTLGDIPVNVGPWYFPAHSPERHYLYFRNVCLMLKRTYVPWAWKKMELLKLLPRFLVYSLATKNKLNHIEAMLLGLWHGCFYSKKNKLAK